MHEFRVCGVRHFMVAGGARLHNAHVHMHTPDCKEPQTQPAAGADGANGHQQRDRAQGKELARTPQVKSVEERAHHQARQAPAVQKTRRGIRTNKILPTARHSQNVSAPASFEYTLGGELTFENVSLAHSATDSTPSASASSSSNTDKGAEDTALSLSLPPSFSRQASAYT